MTLANRVSLVTGAGSGIGTELVKRLHARGDIVLALGRRVEPLEQLKSAVEADRERIVPLACDVRDKDALDAALEPYDAIHTVVANAGVCLQARLDDANADEIWRQVMGINVDGVWFTLRAAGPKLVDNGRVIAVSSGLGKLGRDGYSAYAASKHAVLGIVKSLAKELAPRRITVNAVCPGWVKTEMSAGDLLYTAEHAEADAEVLRAEAIEGIPLGRFVEADEVAALIAWLAGDEAAAITGQAYNISGGEFFA